MEIKGGEVVVENHLGTRQTLKTLISLTVGDFVLSQQNVVIEKMDRDLAEDILTLLKKA